MNNNTFLYITFLFLSKNFLENTTKKLKSHIHFMSNWSCWWRWWKTKISSIDIDGKLCGFTVNGSIRNLMEKNKERCGRWGVCTAVLSSIFTESLSENTSKTCRRESDYFSIMSYLHRTFWVLASDRIMCETCELRHEF